MEILSKKQISIQDEITREDIMFTIVFVSTYPMESLPSIGTLKMEDIHEEAFKNNGRWTDIRSGVYFLDYNKASSGFISKVALSISQRNIEQVADVIFQMKNDLIDKEIFFGVRHG
jgi:hypothetical protein